MQIFLVLGISLFLTIFGSSQWTRYAKTTGTDSLKVSSLNYAGNLYMYNDFALQYLFKNYNTIINDPTNTFVNNIAYNKINNFDLSKLQTFYSNYIDFKQFNTYQSSYFLYSANPNDSSVPQLYLITTFDNTDDFKVRNMFGAYNNLLTTKDNPGDSVYWTNSIFGIYNGSTDNPILLSTLPKGVPATLIPILKNNIFPTLVRGGFNMQKYFIIVPVYMNN